MILVALTGTSSKQQSLVSRLAASQPTLVASPTISRRRPPVRQRQVQRRLTAEQAQQLATEYEAGASIQELAARWGIHRTTVAAQLRQTGVQLRSRGVPADRRAEVVRLYNHGWSCQRLAERYGCNATTVWKVLQRAGVRLRASWERR
jgi:DNA-directed RNA polymerase specialized sigma24 family protein